MNSLYRRSTSAAVFAAIIAAAAAPQAAAGGHYSGASPMAGPAQDMNARLSRVETDQRKAQAALLDELGAVRKELDELKAQLAMGAGRPHEVAGAD